ncbi:hypothetical protein J4G33_06400 [Actinotalea sp. BY-33]|uniref:Methylase-associated X1 domain-containing protein n=1 Tax=Actinotalea soli TaxID=2819234 RepID=A0A939LNQ1_9CELL|nr:hypothetical protein [Actinotalea soli]MBO1751431.1 hypothetical protein [Actinotalea soli]
MQHPPLAARAFGEVYRVQGRSDLHTFLVEAVEASGGRVLYASDPRLAPVYLGVQLDSDERIGMLIYPFRITRNSIKNRPADEVRGQLRYGSQASWKRAHPIGRDVAGVDVSMIVGIDTAGGVLLGLDANLWDPLPMGISFYAKSAEVDRAASSGWHVWEKTNKPGAKRSEPRSPTNFETVVGFTQDRLIDYARLERRATSLRLDSPLRYSAAVAFAGGETIDSLPHRHVLEEQFALTSEQILDIIRGRNRLSVAVRGGVAEHHLENLLRRTVGVAAVDRLDTDSMHDFNVRMSDGRVLRVECKNASPKISADGRFKVEVQKTRSSKNDPASRFYPLSGFDVVAACLFSPTGKWEFRYGATSQMRTHAGFPDRLAPIQAITDDWVERLDDVGHRDPTRLS